MSEKRSPAKQAFQHPDLVKLGEEMSTNYEQILQEAKQVEKEA